MKRKIIIDTDPGQDDAVAILLALASPELDVLGITAVAGNVPLHLTEKNARIICELAGKTDVTLLATSKGENRVKNKKQTSSITNKMEELCQKTVIQ